MMVGLIALSGSAVPLCVAGAATWAKTYGGTGADRATDVQMTADGGYIVAGATDSYGAGGTDAWVLKLDSDGNVVWQNVYGGAGTDEAVQCGPRKTVGTS